MTHFGRTWDGELVTVSRIFTAHNQKGDSVFRADSVDSGGKYGPLLHLGGCYGYHPAQELLNSIGIKLTPGQEIDGLKIEVIAKLFGRQSYTFEQLMEGDELLECIPVKNVTKGMWLWDHAAWRKVIEVHDVAVIATGDNHMRHITYADYISDNEKLPHVFSEKYATTKIIVREDASEKAKAG